MSTITGILQSLGINSTLFIQLGVFLIVFAFIWALAFGPYFKAFLIREENTTGNQEEASQLIAKTRELEGVYQHKAREMNTDIKAIFDEERLAGQKQHERIMLDAKDKAKAAMDKTKAAILEQYNRAREELIKEAPALGKSIAARLLSKEM